MTLSSDTIFFIWIVRILDRMNLEILRNSFGLNWSNIEGAMQTNMKFETQWGVIYIYMKSQRKNKGEGRGIYRKYFIRIKKNWRENCKRHLKMSLLYLKLVCFGSVWFYDMSIIMGHLMPNPFYTYATRIVKYVSRLFFVRPLLLIVHTWKSSPLRSNLLRLQGTCWTVPTTSGRPHGSPLEWACQWPSQKPLSSSQLSHNDSVWA